MFYIRTIENTLNMLYLTSVINIQKIKTSIDIIKRHKPKFILYYWKEDTKHFFLQPQQFSHQADYKM